MKFLLLLIIYFSVLFVQAQERSLNEKFQEDFKKSLNKSFSEDALNEMFREYSAILTAGSDVTQLSEKLKGNLMVRFPLADFKNTKLYIDNIDYLLNSPNKNHNILAYLTIGAAGDTSKESILLKRITAEKNKGNLLWAGMTLLYFHCNYTTPLFDFLVEYEDFGDAHMLPMYIQLNKDSLQNTAYRRINSGNIKAKILAAQILSVTPLNLNTEQLLKQAVQKWDIKIKGYAIYSIRELKIGNLLEVLKPLLDSSQTRSIALGALANSPTVADQNYLLELVNKQDTVSEDLLNCLYESKNIVNVKYWLKLIYNKHLPKDYVFFVFKQPFIRADDLLTDLQVTLKTLTASEILSELVRALEGRTDDVSIDIMIDLLKHKNSTVRYWTAKTLENNPSPRINSEINELIEKGLEDGNK